MCSFEITIEHLAYSSSTPTFATKLDSYQIFQHRTRIGDIGLCKQGLSHRVEIRGYCELFVEVRY